jgi:prephenate dehydrogenase
LLTLLNVSSLSNNSIKYHPPIKSQPPVSLPLAKSLPFINPDQSIVIAGVGLIGGSIGMALKALPQPPKVIGLGRNAERLQKAVELQAIDSFTTDWQQALANAALIVLCGPVSTIAEQARLAWANRPSDALLITDAGSTKSEILAQIADTPQLAAAFVGGHPIAGSEQSGVEAARVNLFQGKLCIITPIPANPLENVENVRQFWQAVGFRVTEMPPDQHDEALALTSHLPHALSAALSRMVGPNLHHLSAGAFRDMTRIAGADTNLWRDILLSNKKTLGIALDSYIRELLNLKEILSNESSEELVEWWELGRRHRKSFESPSGK